MESAQNRRHMQGVVHAEHNLQTAVQEAQSQLEAIELRAYVIGQERALEEADCAQRENVKRLEDVAQTEHVIRLQRVEHEAQEAIDNARAAIRQEANDAFAERLHAVREHEHQQSVHAQQTQYELTQALR